MLIHHTAARAQINTSYSWFIELA